MPNKRILIIGGGISGVTTAVEIAEVGHEVILIEKLPYLGGNVVKFNNYFPKLCPPICGMEINFRRIKQNPRIEVLTSTTVKKISGQKGDFTVTLTKEAELINDNCTACGECENVCPVEKPNEFNHEMDKTKAAYLPYEMTFPFKYTIDKNVCLKNACNKCVEVCKYNAIDLEKKSEDIEIKVSSIVFATGWNAYDASKIENLKFNEHPDIITNVMMERLLSANGPTGGKLIRRSDGKEIKSIAFVQCAGSRDEKHLPYCSGVCCSASLKHALNIREINPDAKIKIFYIDIRVNGRNEDFLNKVIDDKNIELIKGKVGNIEISKTSGKLKVEAEDIMSGLKSKDEVDMVVLATGIVPNNNFIDEIKVDEYGFIIDEQNIDGIYGAACAKKPMDVSASLKDATGMALKAIQN
ncbi:MAG: FAD-dependent oxidoreductase [Pirellulales bacterium]|nr:FAD-dependent oxidoreductase [Pirellulales bacterium]